MTALDELSDASQEVLEEELQLGEVLEEVDDKDRGFQQIHWWAPENQAFRDTILLVFIVWIVGISGSATLGGVGNFGYFWFW